MELVEQLISRLGDGEQVSKELKVVSLAFEDFNIPWFGNLMEMLLVLQCLQINILFQN